MRKMLALILVLVMVMPLCMAHAEEIIIEAVCDGSAEYKFEAEKRDEMMGWDGHSFFAEYMDGDTKAGITALVEAGKVTVNGFAADIESIASALKTSGANVTLTVEDGKATALAVTTTAGVLVDVVRTNEDGTITLISQGQEVVTAPAENVGEGVAAYTCCVYWETPEGMFIELADSRTGIITKSGDHDYLVMNIDGEEVFFDGADMYPRGGSAGNRPGGFANTADRMGVNDFTCTAWLIPGTMGTDNEMIILFTSVTEENAIARLEAVVAKAQALVDMTVIAADADAAAAAAAEAGLEEYHWVREEDIAIVDGVKAAIAAAQEAMVAGMLGQDADSTAYDVYISVYGSNSDVSAVFMGTAKDGYWDVADDGVNALPAAVLF